MLDCVKVAAYSLCESKLGNLVKSGMEEYGEASLAIISVIFA